MLKNKMFWYFCMMPGAVAGWLFTLFGLLFPIQNETIKILWIIVACTWGIGHILELAVSIPIGRSKGVSVKTTLLKTIALGFTWWVPLKMGVTVK
ncbi:MAG: hypothetical protein ABSC11_02805 [Smithella sp.]